MLKKITTLALTIFLLVAFNNVLTAQTPNSVLSEADIKMLNESASMFEGQKPLTDAEVKKYIEMLPQMIEAGNDEAKVLNLITENNFDPLRFVYISIKLPIAISINEDAKSWKENLEKLPNVLKPSKDEIATATKYVQEMQKSMKQ